MHVRLAGLLIVVLAAGGVGGWGGDLGFSAGVGLDVTYTPVPPTSFNIGSDLVLAFDVAGFSFGSVTGFDLSGFRSEIVTLGVDWVQRGRQHG